MGLMRAAKSDWKRAIAWALAVVLLFPIFSAPLSAASASADQALDRLLSQSICSSTGNNAPAHHPQTPLGRDHCILCLVCCSLEPSRAADRLIEVDPPNPIRLSKPAFPADAVPAYFAQRLADSPPRGPPLALVD
jgi:hypothetical protein